MLAQQRQAEIAELVRVHGVVRVVDLAARFGVSDMTVRRDLEALANKAIVVKVHGGAAATASSPPRDFGERWFRPPASTTRHQEKNAIAAAAARLVDPGSAIAMGGGTTTMLLARHLAGVPGLTVVTNSLPVSDLLHHFGRPDQTVIVTGGTRTPSDALAGPLAVAALRDLHVERTFLGAHGMSAAGGFRTPNLLEAATNRAFVAGARELVVVVDSAKWGHAGLATFAQLDEARIVVSDAGLTAEARGTLEDRVERLVLVDPTGKVARTHRTP